MIWGFAKNIYWDIDRDRMGYISNYDQKLDYFPTAKKPRIAGRLHHAIMKCLFTSVLHLNGFDLPGKYPKMAKHWLMNQDISSRSLIVDQYVMG